MAYQFSATTSFSDETYLESFVESISASLPNEIKRNLDHLRDLDNASCKLLEEWRDNQDGCLQGVEETLVNVFHAEAANSILTGGDDGDDGGGKGGGGSDIINITPIKMKIEKLGSNKKRRKSQERSSPESPKKVACTKCRAKKVRCDGRQPYCLNRSKEPSSSSSLDDMLYCSPASSPKKQKVEETTTNNDGSSARRDIPTISQEQLTSYLIKRGPPTATEIQTALDYNPRYNSQREEIKSMYENLRQYSNEKMETANQLKSMIDMALGRLDRDIQTFESELGIDPNVNVGVAHSTELGGGMMMGGSSGGVSHHVHGHHPVGGGVHGVVGAHSQHLPSISSSLTSGYQAATAIANNAANLHQSSTTVSRPPLPASAALHHHQQQQQHSYPSTMRGVIPPKSVQTNNLAAIQITPNTDYILAKILTHDKSTKMYTLSDEDVMSNQIYKLPEGKQVIPLKNTDRNKWIRGDVCYAVYPDTTSFYRATVSTPPFNGFVMVQFKDDWDVNGVTHEKAVLMGHIMKVPVGRK